MRNLWASFERLLNFWSIFWLFFFFIVQSFKNEISSKILDTQKYNIVRHWFSSKNWIFSIFFKKVSIDGFTYFSSKIHPKFSKNQLFHIPQYIIYLWSEFYARSNNQTIRIFGYWEIWASFIGPFFDYFFYCPKFQKWNFFKNPWYTKIQHCTTFFFTVSIDGFTHYLWKILLNFQSFKNEISSKILDTQKYKIVRHWFSSKNWIFSIFFKKVSIDGFTHFSSKIHPKFSKNQLFHIPQYIIYLWSEFYARSNNQTIRIFG